MIEQPTGTLCMCGHYLEACADCRDWLTAESPRIAEGWHYRVELWGRRHLIWSYEFLKRWIAADHAEADNLAYYQSTR